MTPNAKNLARQGSDIGWEVLRGHGASCTHQVLFHEAPCCGLVAMQPQRFFRRPDYLVVLRALCWPDVDCSGLREEHSWSPGHPP